MTPATRARISELLTALEAWAEAPDPSPRTLRMTGNTVAAHLDAPATIRELARLWRGEEEA